MQHLTRKHKKHLFFTYGHRELRSADRTELDETVLCGKTEGGTGPFAEPLEQYVGTADVGAQETAYFELHVFGKSAGPLYTTSGLMLGNSEVGQGYAGS